MGALVGALVGASLSLAFRDRGRIVALAATRGAGRSTETNADLIVPCRDCCHAPFDETIGAFWTIHSV